jgi:Tfp pilus assembly protein FimT
MNMRDLSKAKDPDVRSALAALQRAAELARTEAIQTNTSIIIVKNGKIVHVTAEELHQERALKAL